MPEPTSFELDSEHREFKEVCDRFVRNVLIAAGNSNDPTVVAACRALLADPSPLVRGAAVWALSQLISRQALKTIEARHAPAEADVQVLAEWAAATGSPSKSASQAGAAA